MSTSAYGWPLSPKISMQSSIPPGRFQLLSTIPTAPILEFHDGDRFILALRAIAMHLRRHVRVHAFDLGFAEEPPAKGDTVTAEVHDRAAAGLFDVPEPGRVRAGVLLALLDEVHAAERPFVRHLFRFHVLRREEQLLLVQ